MLGMKQIDIYIGIITQKWILSYFSLAKGKTKLQKEDKNKLD